MRYAAKSELAKSLVNCTHDILKENGHLFEFRRSDSPLLLVLDRRDDPVTPLLNQVQLVHLTQFICCFVESGTVSTSYTIYLLFCGPSLAILSYQYTQTKNVLYKDTAYTIKLVHLIQYSYYILHILFFKSGSGAKYWPNFIFIF